MSRRRIPSCVLVMVALFFVLSGLTFAKSNDDADSATSLLANGADWDIMKALEVTSGYPFKRALNYASLIELAGSPYHSKPYAKFGWGTHFAEGFLPGRETGRLTSAFPLYLYYVPYLRAKCFWAHPIVSTRGGYGYNWIEVTYDASREEPYIFAKTFVYFFVGGSAWVFINSYDYESDLFMDIFGKRRYISCGFSIMRCFQITSGPVASNLDFIRLGANARIMLTKDIHDSSNDMYFFLTLSFGVGPMWVGKF
ncbi:MAG: hypothetical protein NT028_09860 [candidate division Zixibacteria bacterium]|nr:hypothetical protein [candidate division Zixibacteria bacterium]